MSQKGLNKIEILVLMTLVIAIIIIFINFALDIQKSARDSKRRGDIETISKQLEIHYNRYAAEFCQDVELDTYCHPQSSWFDKSKVPVDPLTGDLYSLPSDGDKKFNICAKLEKGGQYCEESQQ